MVMSIQISADAAALLTAGVLLDTVQLLDVGEPVTVGSRVTRSLTPVGGPIPGLVQTTVLQNSAESITQNVYSAKFPVGTVVKAGQAVRVVTCVQEPDLVGKVLLLDKVSQNGASIVRKAVASDATVVNQQGKEFLV